MTHKDQVRIGEALLPILTPFHEVDGCVLRSVWESSVDGEIESVSFQFDSGILRLQVNIDDDTVDVSFSSQHEALGECVDLLTPWRNQIGKEFGWGWAGFNQQGYLDTVSLSFGSISPQFSITAVASSLHLTKNNKVIKRIRQERKQEYTRRGIELAA